ncbi:ATP-binding protein [Thermococcus sp. MAR1]|nr:ATP-binding protein [Thermococcus sp. MAR1]
MMEEQNPWWFHETDPDWEEFEELEYRVMPKWTSKISLVPFSLNIVIGPRRVGKTMGMKLLIRELLRREENPYALFYFDCGVLENYREIVEVVNEYIKIKERKGIKTSYIFLDEVTLVPDWWRAVKYLVDRRKLKLDVITITGSVTIAAERHIGAFGGRQGNGKTVEVMPLSFRGYYNLFHEDFFPSKGQEVFERYLETGGYLAYLNRKLRTNEVVSVIKADVRALGKSTSAARDVIGAILDVAPDPVSLRKLAERAGVSAPTVREYLELFEGLHILLPIPFIDAGGRILPRKDRKFAIRDPLLARAVAQWTGRELSRAVLYEWVVQEHLYRRFGEIFYFRTDWYEIDAIAGGMKVEVKSGLSRRGYPRDVLVLEGRNVPEFLYGL